MEETDWEGGSPHMGVVIIVLCIIFWLLEGAFEIMIKDIEEVGFKEWILTTSIVVIPIFVACVIFFMFVVF